MLYKKTVDLVRKLVEYYTLAMKRELPVEFMLNKALQQAVAFRPDTTILNLLRKRGLVGTKEACASGDCGACTVMLGECAADGRISYRAINACIALAGSLEGKHLVTVEGLAEGGELHPAQQALVDAHGSQCGYCTPGFVMSLANLVEDQAVPDTSESEQVHTGRNIRDEVIRGISGNLCRCTGYRPIVDAGINALTQESSVTVCHDEARSYLQAVQHEQPGSDYFNPTSLDELDKLIATHGKSAMVAGTTDFALEITQRWLRVPVIIDVSRVAEMLEIGVSDSEISIGAAVSYSDLETLFAESSSQFVHLLHRLGSRQIRNRGTLGGNIGNASPIADTPPVLIAWDARLELRDSSGEVREVGVDEFYTGYRETVLKSDEYIVRVTIPRSSIARFHRFYKHSKRIEDDISSVMGAISITGVLRAGVRKIEIARISYGGMAAVPVRCVEVERLLLTTRLDDRLIAKACDLLKSTMTPMSDVRSSAEFRMAMAVEMLNRALREFLGESLPRVDER